jgi:hypothetical protein
MKFRIAGKSLRSPSVYDMQDPDRITGDDVCGDLSEAKLTLPLNEAIARSRKLVLELCGISDERAEK